MSKDPKFVRAEVCKNLSVAFRAFVRSSRLGLHEMLFEGNRHNGVIRDAVLEGCQAEGIDLTSTERREREPKRKDSCLHCGNLLGPFCSTECRKLESEMTDG